MLRLFNTLTRTQEPFTPSRDNTVRMYACGPTVYARAHIGNFRTFVCLDVLRRALKYVGGHAVRMVVNYTDVDDKTINGANASGESLRDYTERWVVAFREDAASLGLETPEETPRATDDANMQAMSPRAHAATLATSTAYRKARGHVWWFTDPPTPRPRVASSASREV